MAFRHRRSREIEEGESYYISMTDLMVGVLFIFIIMLAYFALNFRETTTELTQAKDPQTSALLKLATNLKSLNATIDVDRENHIVCVQESDLLGLEGGKDRRCFAFSGQTAINPSSDEEKRSAASVAFFAADMQADLAPTISWAEVSLSDASTRFDADRLFRAGTSELTPEGLSAVSNLAQSLANRLPCLSYGLPAEGCSGQGKLEAVVILGTADVNMYTAQGRADHSSDGLCFFQVSSLADRSTVRTNAPVAELMRLRPFGSTSPSLKTAPAFFFGMTSPGYTPPH